MVLRLLRNETPNPYATEEWGRQPTHPQQLNECHQPGRTLAMRSRRLTDMGLSMKTLGTVTTTACLACCLVATVVADGELSIPDHLRENGSYERIIVFTDRPVLLADLVGSADLVVEAFPVSERSYLGADESQIYTDYAFTLTDVVKNRRRPGMLKAGHSIVVRRESGTVIVNGLRATTIENGFPPFSQNSRYLLFLKEGGDQNAYVVLGGGRGAFEAGDEIAPMLSGGEAPPSTLKRQAFLGEVKALLKFSE
jgi:hypothetical protein